jgi:hypothetical protein
MLLCCLLQGDRLEDSPGLPVLQRSLEKTFLFWLRTSLGNGHLPENWSEEQRAAWRSARPGALRAEDVDVWEASLHLCSEVLKLKLVDAYQKHREALCRMECASPAERVAMQQEKKAAAALLVEGGADTRAMSMDPATLEAAELTDILLIVIKRLYKMEVRELVLQDIQPALRNLAAAVLMIVVLVALWWGYTTGWLHSATGIEVFEVVPVVPRAMQSDVSGLRQCVDQLDEDSGGGFGEDTAAELALVVEQLAVLVQRLEAASAKTGGG